MIVGIISSIIVTRALGPDGKGVFQAALLLVMFYAPALTMGYRSGVLYEGLKSQKIDVPNFFMSGLMLMALLGVAIVTFLMMFISLGWLGTIITNLHVQEKVIIGLLIVTTLLSNYCQVIMIIFTQFRKANLSTLYKITLVVLLNGALYLVGELSVGTALLTLVIGTFVEFLIRLHFIVRKINVHLVLSIRSALIPFYYGLKSWVGDVLNRTNNELDKVIINFLLISSSFGVYTTGVGLAKMVNQIPSSYASVFFNKIALEGNRERQIELFLLSQRLNFLINSLVLGLLILLGRNIVLVFYGPDFIGSYTVLWIYGLGLVFHSNSILILKFYGAIGKPLKNSLIHLCGLMFGLPAYFVLIPKFGITGAAMGSSIAYLGAYIFGVFQIKKEFNINLLKLFSVSINDLVFLKDRVLTFGKK